MESSMRLAPSKTISRPAEAAACVRRLVEDGSQPIPVETLEALRKVSTALEEMAKRSEGEEEEKGAKGAAKGKGKH